MIILTYETIKLFESKNKDIYPIVADKIIEEKERYFKLTDEPKK